MSHPSRVRSKPKGASVDAAVSEQAILGLMDSFGKGDSLEEKASNEAINKSGDDGVAIAFSDPLAANPKKIDEALDDENLPDESDSASNYSDTDVDTEKNEEAGSEDEEHTFVMRAWRDLFEGEDYFLNLKDKAARGRLNPCIFRNICWKLFVDCLQEDRTTWKDDVAQQRSIYEALKQQHLQSPHNTGTEVDLALNNPLSQDKNSPWHQYFVDSELRALIMQDVNRLFPGVEFFQKPDVRKSVIDMLFCFAKEHPHMSYRQGMHEIIAPILYVHINDYEAARDAQEVLDDVITNVLDVQFIEHDTYYLFSQIMDVIEPWYVQLDNLEKSPEPPKKSGLFVNKSPLRPSSAIFKKLNRIQNFMLKRYDHQLFAHLKKLDVEPQLYGIRWIRLLFGREFDFPELLQLWDVLFADGPTLDLVDYIYLAMLMNIRNLLLRSDYSTCMAHLMKYPRPDVRYVTMKAMSLRENKSARPAVHAARHGSSHHAQAPHGGKTQVTRNRQKESLTEEQQFAKALGSSVSQARLKKSAPEKLPPAGNPSSQWYQSKDILNDAEPVDSATARRRQTMERLQRDPTPVSKHDIHPDYHRQMAIKQAQEQQQQQQQLSAPARVSANVTSHISSMLNKHKVGSPTQVLSKLATRAKPRGKDSDLVSQLAEDHVRLQRQICELQSDFERLQSLCLFCGGKMESYLGFLQTTVQDDSNPDSDVTALSVAGLKQVKDVLNSTMDFRGTGKEHETDFTDIDKQISVVCCRDISSSPPRQESPPPSEKETPPSSPSHNLVTSEADYEHYRTDKELHSAAAPTAVFHSLPVDINRTESSDTQLQEGNVRNPNESTKGDWTVTLRSLSSDEFCPTRNMEEIGNESDGNSLNYSGISDPLSQFQVQ